MKTVTLERSRRRHIPIDASLGGYTLTLLLVEQISYDISNNIILKLYKY